MISTSPFRHGILCVAWIVGLAVGGACSSGKDSDSAVLTASGATPSLQALKYRISLGHWLSADDLSPLLNASGRPGMALHS